MMRTNFICQLLLLAVAIFPPVGKTQNPNPAEAPPIARFVDVAAKAGLSAPNVFGGVDRKKYIIETTGTGVAIFDFDNDSWPDIFLVNGTTLEKVPAKKRRRVTFLTTIMMGRSPMLRRNPVWGIPDGDKVSVSGTMTTTAGKTCM